MAKKPIALAYLKRGQVITDPETGQRKMSIKGRGRKAKPEVDEVNEAEASEPKASRKRGG